MWMIVTSLYWMIIKKAFEFIGLGGDEIPEDPEISFWKRAYILLLWNLVITRGIPDAKHPWTELVGTDEHVWIQIFVNFHDIFQEYKSCYLISIFTRPFSGSESISGNSVYLSVCPSPLLILFLFFQTLSSRNLSHGIQCLPCPPVNWSPFPIN